VPTPAELRERADRLDIEGRAALAEAKRLRHVARKLERLQETFASPSLTSPRDDNNVLPVPLGRTVTERARRPPAELSTRLAIGMKNATRRCLFSDWLTSTSQTATSWALAPEHRRPNKTPKWAPSAVRAWMLAPERKSARAVPEAAATLIAAESGGAVPAEDSAWPNGISRPRRRPA
jgi:hypothetical protein